MRDETIHEGELLGERAFSAEDIARACGVELTWVRERVEIGVLHANGTAEEWRFDSTSLVRARRIAQLESGFGADPQLAALAADLIEEVQALRKRLEMLQG